MLVLSVGMLGIAGLASASLRTHPVTGNRRAIDWAVARKPTPWTRP